MAGVLRPALTEGGWKGEMAIHDYLLPEGRQALAAAAREEGLDRSPSEVANVIDQASYFFAFMALPQRKVILTGHPPRQQIEDALTLPGLPARLLLSQEDMHSSGTKYEVWDFQRRIASFPIETSLREALERGGMLSASTGAP